MLFNLVIHISLTIVKKIKKLNYLFRLLKEVYESGFITHACVCMCVCVSQ